MEEILECEVEEQFLVRHLRIPNIQGGWAQRTCLCSARNEESDPYSVSPNPRKKKSPKP